MGEFTDQELQEARSLGEEIDNISVEIQNTERASSSNWIRLGSLVYKVRQKKYWSALGYKSFGQYVLSLEPKINRKRSQVYLCVGVVEALASQISEEDLQKIGITKASELKKYVHETGKLVPRELIDAALDESKTIDNVRAEVAESLHKEPHEKGSWWDFGGFFITDEEKALIESTIELAKKVAPVIPHDWPEHMQRKEIFVRLCMEFQSVYVGAE